MTVYLDPALSSRRTAAAPARELAGCSRAAQDLVLHWGAVIARDNTELAYQFSVHAADAIRRMELEDVESWLLHAMDLYDRKGQMSAIRALQEVAEFAADRQAHQARAALEGCAGILERFVCALSGRALAIAAHERCFTDTETIHLPPVLDRLADKQANFRLYKAMAVHQWAQNWYGTWRGGQLLEAVESGALPAADLPRLHALETIRLDACLARDFPALQREMAALRRQLDGADVPLPAALAVLAEADTTVRDSLRLLGRCRQLALDTCCYGGELDPAAVRARLDPRTERERNRLRIALARLVRAQDGTAPGGGQEDDPAADQAETVEATRERLGALRQADPDAPDGLRCQLLLDGRPVAAPADVHTTMESIIQDLGDIPPAYLVAAGPGLYRQRAGGEDDEDTDPNAIWAGAYRETGAICYDEWDFSRRRYRKHWCLLREHELPAGGLGFFERTLEKHRGLIKSVRHTFELLRGESRTLKRQPHGDDIDIDALIEAHADVRAGREMSSRLFRQRQRDERSIAVMLMVDMSGSTKGWINQAEREALILLSEALVTLGDGFAIYGFSGWTRKRCEVYPVKRFDAPYDRAVKARICAVAPKDYTRMGAPIRHLTGLLKAREARTKLLITLSDGKPDDYDPQYRGKYGIEDTRQALLEARLAGVHPFCITIDEKGADYLPHLYGAANYTVVADVAKLPTKVAEIYRRLAC